MQTKESELTLETKLEGIIYRGYLQQLITVLFKTENLKFTFIKFEKLFNDEKNKKRGLMIDSRKTARIKLMALTYPKAPKIIEVKRFELVLNIEEKDKLK